MKKKFGSVNYNSIVEKALKMTPEEIVEPDVAPEPDEPRQGADNDDVFIDDTPDEFDDDDEDEDEDGEEDDDEEDDGADGADDPDRV